MSDRFAALETEDAGGATTPEPVASTLTIEKIVDYMARNSIASIHVGVPTPRTNDKYTEVKYKVTNRK